MDELELPSVPEYNPTPEQFKDPLAYIQTIYDQAALYGVCIINPPKESWNVTVGPADWESACKAADFLLGRLRAEMQTQAARLGEARDAAEGNSDQGERWVAGNSAVTLCN